MSMIKKKRLNPSIQDETQHKAARLVSGGVVRVGWHLFTAQKKPDNSLASCLQCSIWPNCSHELNQICQEMDSLSGEDDAYIMNIYD